MASTRLPVADLDASASAIGTTAPPGALLALDLGTTTGWALQLIDGAVHSGTVSFRPSRFDGGGQS